ncbi:MAG: hypothetical protein WBG43_11405 [Marinifilaceae bacterium]
MKRIIALLMILILASLAFNANGQQIVEKGQIRKYSVNQPSTSKFSWTIFKSDGITPADPTKYKLFRERPIDPVIALSENLSTPSQSITGGTVNSENTVYIYWLGDENQEFIVSAREYDVNTECSDAIYNTIKENVIIRPLVNMFRANISWGGIEDCNLITSDEYVINPITNLKEAKYYSTFSFNIETWNLDNRLTNKWFYKYKYIVVDNVHTPPTVNEWLNAPTFNSNQIDGNIRTDIIVLDKIEIKKGDGKALVWIKLVLVKDGHNTSALDNPLTNCITHAVVKKLPKDQLIRLVD